jgi:hypothetical protein
MAIFIICKEVVFQVPKSSSSLFPAQVDAIGADGIPWVWKEGCKIKNLSDTKKRV